VEFELALDVHEGIGPAKEVRTCGNRDHKRLRQPVTFFQNCVMRKLIAIIVLAVTGCAAWDEAAPEARDALTNAVRDAEETMHTCHQTGAMSVCR
jgi:hypothetical protein